MGDYNSFVNKVNDEIGIDLNLYNEAQMSRRLTSLRNKRSFTDFSSYYLALSRDDGLKNEFLDRITINVSEFYRDPRRWDVLRDIIIPELIKNKKHFTIWSTACSTGEEPYSLAIMLQEHFSNITNSIIATDIDEEVLLKAKEGVYHPSALKDLPAHKKSKYFLFKNNKFHINEKLKASISFKKHNLLKDPHPPNLDLIVCRNVLNLFY
ncbi:CheR family methyltransferase [Pseudogracilibacillus sp. SO30301A]|uniref:CheR family methyltransferase n=1 Tax=Pseudogracilibacillus sp. SO30301A TaxID=3098291 RepID=UPI00300E0592